MGTNSGTSGTKEINKNYPTPSTTGVGADDYHKNRQMNLVAEDGSYISKKEKQLLE